MKSKNYYVYVLTNIKNSVIYIGVTSNLEKRMYQHKTKTIEGFTEKYNCNKLIYFETTTDVRVALEREKQLKRWHREWKWNLVKETNPQLNDLSEDWFSSEILKPVQDDSNFSLGN